MMRAQKQQSLQPYKWVYLFSKSTSARLSWGNLLPLQPTINGCWGQMRWESNLCAGKRELHHLPRGPCAACPSTSWGWGSSREQPRSRGGRPGPDLDSGVPSKSVLERGRCWECSLASPSQNEQSRGQGCPHLFLWMLKQELRINLSWKQRVDSRLRFQIQTVKIISFRGC